MQWMRSRGEDFDLNSEGSSPSFEVITQRLVENMMTSLKATHLVSTIVVAFLYLFFQIEVNDNTALLSANLLLFLVLFVWYGIIAYLLFHSSPGFEDPTSSTSQIGVQNVYEYQTNQQRRETISRELSVKGLADVYLAELEEQLIFLYARTSFCDSCKFIKRPRSHHCEICGRCVLRKEFHSRMLGMCIGERNLKIYIQYILVLLLGALHIACTSFLCVVIESSQLKSWNTFKRILYWLLCAAASYMAVLLCFYLGKMMQRLSRNITKEEAKIKSFWNKNPFADENYYRKLFPTWKDCLETNYKNEDFEMEMASSERIPTLSY